MELVSVSKFKATCLEILRRVKESGQPVVVTKRGEPIAQVIPPPLPERTTSWVGSMAGTGQVLGDIVFPAALEDEWEVLRNGNRN
jgi:prevent-host-death family protein